MRKIKVKMIDCTFNDKKIFKKHKLKKKRITVYFCERKCCSWYAVPSISGVECVMVEVDGLKSVL